ncbi:LacI family DNA-binding transcriptional regulator [uncultured Secundilactobacillus sp.]|uniref:LacI family DNA-binding transcriptional regulator n=1 Tax=uncultured Secundilactobacillus sp. TaxID=2813935 RepID=UPI00258B3586|nr:LacI family DNA-binding transcriptional regulator [uncultured Secundilactobacillus sp.]
MAHPTDKPTIKAVAKRAGVSEATVSRAMNGSPLVKPETKQRIESIIHEMGYRPNILARSMRTNQSKTIGVVISSVTNAFFTAIIGAIQEAAADQGYSVIITNTDENPDHEKAAIQMLQGHMVAGFIIASTSRLTDYHALLGPDPAVFIDREPGGQADHDYDSLLVDNTAGAQAVVETLIAQGATRIGMIASGVSTAGQERLRGYLRALQAHGMPYDPDIVYFSDVQQTKARQHTSQLLINQACDGLFAADVTLIQAALAEIEARHLTHIKLGAFDNVVWFDYLSQPVTTAEQPTDQMGHQAVNLLIDRIKGRSSQPTILRLPTRLIKRG